MAQALLVMVHGSPRPQSNDGMWRVVEMLRQREAYPIIEVGFLDCNTPTIAEAIEKCVAQGAEAVVAVPYFLHAGNHVADDLPGLLEAAQAQYPHVSFLMGDYLGHDPLIAEVVLERAMEASPLE